MLFFKVLTASLAWCLSSLLSSLAWCFNSFSTSLAWCLASFAIVLDSLRASFACALAAFLSAREEEDEEKEVEEDGVGEGRCDRFWEGAVKAGPKGDGAEGAMLTDLEEVL